MTSVRDEGVIKFHCQWKETSAFACDSLSELIDYRNRLFLAGLIGVYDDGIGFGNISIRLTHQEVLALSDACGEKLCAQPFLISASQTGHIEMASPEHFSLVTTYDIGANSVTCAGPMKASSESLTHAMVFETFPKALAVVHVHHNASWQALQGQVPTSSASVPYGTPAMAKEIQRLADELERHPVLVMAGHEDGILTFGRTLDEAAVLALRATSLTSHS